MKISILMAVKNEEKYVKKAIESICNQEDVDFELIVVDDGSTDNTYAIVKSLQSLDNRLTVFRSSGSGKNAAFNMAFQNSNGDAICLFAGDDIMPKGSLSERRTVFDKENGSAIVLSKMKTISDQRSMNNIVIPKGTGRASTSGASPLIPKIICDRIFPIPEILPNEDTWIDLYLSYFFEAELFHTDIICCYWRIHSGNSISHSQSFEKYSEAYATRASAIKLFAHLNLLKLNNSQVESVCSRILLEHYRMQKSWMWILMSKTSMLDKMRAIVNSSSVLYFVRQKLYRLTSGW